MVTPLRIARQSDLEVVNPADGCPESHPPPACASASSARRSAAGVDVTDPPRFYRVDVDDNLLILLLLGCAFLGMVVFLVALPILIFRWAGRQHEKDSRAWAEFARTHGLSFQLRPPRVTGVFDGGPLSIGLRIAGPAGQMEISTLVRCGPPATRAEPDWLRVSPRGVLARLAATLVSPGPVLETGDAAFDARFLTRAGDGARARAVLSNTVRAHLLAFPREVTLTCTSDALVLIWPHQESERGVLEQACRIVATVYSGRGQ